MKHFMLPRDAILRETEPMSPNPSVSKSKPRKCRSAKENAPPPDLNSLPSSSSSAAAKMKSPLPPRPPTSNPLKRKLSTESSAATESVPSGLSDSGVKVIVRMRPPNKGEEDDMIVQKIANDSLTINGHAFTFDSVADAEASQEDIFQLVGAPLVENCLAGFNSSVFAYGQTGSGKTYTMWGPSNALLDEHLSGDKKGLTPRVFEKLFARINEEQMKHAEKQLNYQCRCSLLEIYNEQITDLLDPSQRHLMIREDVKSGVYVENLTEEYVCSLKDVTQLLIKGLSNRRTGATSVNSESSRSHCVFTCVVESRFKSVADGLSSFRTSRINLVDLAGSERQKLTGAGGERLKEAGNINRSLSQLGNLINILAEISQTGRQRHIPYRDSRLTFLLQESLGGNAKLAMVCAISPSQSCRSETFSTLRFAQRAKAIQNKAVVNEVMQDDVNFLRGVIRQLKDELQRMKANGNNTKDPNGAYATAWNARRSLNLLRSFGLNHPRTLPHGDDDGDTEMEIDEEAVEKLCTEVGMESSFGTEVSTQDTSKVATINSSLQTGAVKEDYSHNPQPKSSECRCQDEQGSEDTDVSMDDVSDHNEYHELTATGETINGEPSLQPSSVTNDPDSSINNVKGNNSPGKLQNLSPCPVPDPSGDISTSVLVADGSNRSPSSLSIVPADVSPVLKSPTLSVSPRIRNSRKSLRTSSTLAASQKDLQDGRLLSPQILDSSSARCMKNPSSNQKSKVFPLPTEHLAASLHRGIEIMEAYRQSTVQRRSTFRFSFKSPESRPSISVCKVDVGVQTFPEADIPEEDASENLCCKCKFKTKCDDEEISDSSNLQLVPVDNSEATEKSKSQVPKAVEKVLTGSIRREMALEEFCARQASEIMQLNRLVQQYKHERECNAILGQTREEKIIRLESLMDGVLPKEDFMDEELRSLLQEHKLLKENYENHPEVLQTKIELKRVQDELERYRNFCDMGEREVLLEEIQDLRMQLQYYIDPSSRSARRRNSLLKLTYSCDPNHAPPLNTIPESLEESAEKTTEQERIQWIEAEGKWISLAEELRTELEASRVLTVKQKHELDIEKRCAEELKEAMQMAMEGHARMLEQYADLEEKHMQLLARHRRIQEGIDDVKKAAVKAGVRGAESRFINSLAAEISALKVEREKERQYFRDENKSLQSQLRDTAEAVQAAGELLVRLKEAEEGLVVAQKRAMEAEHKAAEAYKQIDKLKRKHENETNALNQVLAESRLPKEASLAPFEDHGMAKYDTEDPSGAGDQRWREEFEPLYHEDSDLSKLPEPSSWFSGYDRCNI